ncbi:MAG: PHP domain-containing protein [Anaerolineae bacterium]|nr:PHP domain-containing protein [Anaerolineae bacterium]
MMIKEFPIDTYQRIEYFIRHEQEGLYLTIPFTMPFGMESLALKYTYARRDRDEMDVPQGIFTSRPEINIIDLGLIAPDGTLVGASGSDKTSIYVSETSATPGYRPTKLVLGEWRILVGAYKVALEGVAVSYELDMIGKRQRLLKGDLHVHTLASDGVLTVAELAQHARRHGLDFLAITDHNQMAQTDALPDIPDFTLIPGIEWTHFKGHATFTGVDQPYDGSFAANTPEEVAARFTSARDRGALITIAHPFDESCPFRFDMNSLPFDCLEIWNGPMRVSNLQALGYWHSLLVAGKKIPVCGGSDYHRSQLFLFPGGPTTCVYAESAGVSDILEALRQGHVYIVYAPDGPVLELRAGEDNIMGDSVSFPTISELQIEVKGLRTGDVLQVITAQGSTPLLTAATDGDFEGTYTMTAPGFARVEILREFIPGVPMLPALISNPIYFDAEVD